jgi:UDP-N-acetylglucosamine 2-epimerase (non-hydrolysing)
LIVVVFGTTGELIKLAPVLIRLRDRGVPLTLVTTGQQATQIAPLLDEFGLPQPDVWLARGARGRDLQANTDIPGWLATVVANAARNRRRLRRRLGARGLVLVHGDTMTTFLGALYGRLLRVPVAHLEAGMRSGDLRHPFPEEPIRRVVSRVASIHYAPGAQAVRNLRRGAVVDTTFNTLRDSVALVPRDAAAGVAVPDAPYGIVSLHRFELINDRALFTWTLDLLADAATRTPLLFVDHPVTVESIERFSLGDRFGTGLTRISRQRFFPFVALLRESAFVVTDSGGSQEECYFLDIPCLVHRKTTEHPEGVGENVVVSNYRPDTMKRFLDDPFAHRRREPLAPASPAGLVVDDLARRGFAGAAGA